MTIKEKIAELNTGRIGSFGEYIFYRLCRDKKMKIVHYHKERTDFLLNEDNERIDVKTIRSKIDIENSKIFIYNGIRIKNIKYAVVDFLKKKVVITIEGKPIDDTKIDELDYDSIDLLHAEWKENFKKYDRINKEQKQNHLYKKMVDEIKINLTDFFDKEGFKTYICHRTCQLGFKEQSAHNLLPQYRKDGTIYYRPENRIRIYLDFVTSEISELNLNQIIAYPEMRYKELKQLEKPGLSGYNKVDLKLVPEKYIFTSIADLMKNYRLKFGI